VIRGRSIGLSSSPSGKPGEMLLEAKDQVSYGAWGRWLSEDGAGSTSAARGGSLHQAVVKMGLGSTGSKIEINKWRALPSAYEQCGVFPALRFPLSEPLLAIPYVFTRFRRRIVLAGRSLAFYQFIRVLDLLARFRILILSAPLLVPVHVGHEMARRVDGIFSVIATGVATSWFDQNCPGTPAGRSQILRHLIADIQTPAILGVTKI
jgi:hypothetical protein